MQKIGITGGIAAGKSMASAYLRQKGYLVICADEISRELTKRGAEAIPYIIKEFGESYFDENGDLLRKKLSDLIFSSNEARQRLNSIMHPLILAKIEKQISEANEKIVFVDAPLLYEAGFYKTVDKVWLLSSDVSIRKSRLMKRDNLCEEKADKIICSQMSEEEMRKRADVIIDSSGEVENTRKQIDKLIENLSI